jgi:hypothetical protein
MLDKKDIFWQSWNRFIVKVNAVFLLNDSKYLVLV